MKKVLNQNKIQEYHNKHWYIVNILHLQLEKILQFMLWEYKAIYLFNKDKLYINTKISRYKPNYELADGTVNTEKPQRNQWLLPTIFINMLRSNTHAIYYKWKSTD